MSMFEKINEVINERYLDGDCITLYDKDGELIDKKTVKLEPKSGSQSF